jgi:hypothetical protein
MQRPIHLEILNVPYCFHWIETAGSPTDGLRRRCHDPGEKASKKRQNPPWPWKIFSLDSENLMRVRPDRLSGQGYRSSAIASSFRPGMFVQMAVTLPFAKTITSPLEKFRAPELFGFTLSH